MKLMLPLCQLATALLLWLPFASPAQTPAPAPAETVFAGVPQENIVGEAPDFKLFDQKFYDNQLFFLGESHGVQRPQELDFALLKHLNQRAGVRTYLAEVDAPKAYYLNEYLRTGQDSTLRRVFRSWVAGRAQWGNQDFYHKIQRIRALNQTLPAARRIRFVGIDGLQDLPLAADYVRALLPRQPVPAPLRGQLDSAMTLLRGTATGSLAALGARTAQELERPAARYQQALGADNYANLALLLRNLAYAGQGLSREAMLFANFETVYRTKRLDREKLYGMWGLAHVLQSPVQGNFTMLAARIRQSTLPLHHKVASVLCVFSGCQMLYPSAGLPAPWQTPSQPYSITDKFNHDGPLVVLEGLAELKQRTAPGSSTLFRLDAPGAASLRQPIRLRYAPGMPADQQLQFQPQVPAAAYAQYLLLVRDSGPVQPLRPATGPVGRR
ncbi:erythromycin esterase family protein [Hymenobacter negativus]|uniref:Erythromycin esterase family protein n=1 Tax=Hymenobacter negativus TaxID=2795026 RepID=A0ABS0QAN8_9BACT|nr:erythromycin esterase family protein [Hymenobacter negativus]MBH8559759.1 erythromycin esterase family protein [Hymenobacter negativus]